MTDTDKWESRNFDRGQPNCEAWRWRRDGQDRGESSR